MVMKEFESLLKTGICSVRYIKRNGYCGLAFLTLNREIIESIKTDFKLNNKKLYSKTHYDENKEGFAERSLRELRENDLIVRSDAQIYDYENRHWKNFRFNSLIEAKLLP